jgi:hypothetical protein
MDSGSHKPNNMPNSFSRVEVITGVGLRIPIVPATYSDHYPATVTDCKSGLLTAVSRQV